MATRRIKFSIVIGICAIFIPPFYFKHPGSTGYLSNMADMFRWTVAKVACIEALWFTMDNDVACQRWHAIDDGPPPDILPCPPSLEQAVVDERFVPDGSTGWSLQVFHEGSEISFRQKIPNPKGSGQQCTYRDGKLLLGPPGGGTADVASPVNSFFFHWRLDVIPWCHCCVYGRKPESCGRYYEKRPSDPGTDYVAP